MVWFLASLRLVYSPLTLFFYYSLSVSVCNFSVRPDETFVVVGTAKDMSLNPRSCAGGFLVVYRVVDQPDGGQKLEFFHKVREIFISKSCSP